MNCSAFLSLAYSMKTRFVVAILAIAAEYLWAQPALVPDVTFIANLARPTLEWNWMQQADGRILVGGAFTSVSGKPAKGIARLDPDGQFDDSFAPDATMDRAELAGLQSGNRLIGRITYGDKRIFIRLDAQGKRDPSFQAQEMGSQESILFVRSDDRLLVSSGYGLRLFGPDGGVEKTLIPMALPIEAPSYLAAAEQLDGKLIIGGAFTNVLGVQRTSICRLNSDGSLDQSFAPALRGGIAVRDGVGYPLPGVNRIVPQSDGKLLIGGGFSNVNGVSRLNLARLNLDGTLDEGFIPVPIGDDEHSIAEMSLLGDGKILVAAWGSSPLLIRLNSDGSFDRSISIPSNFLLPGIGPQVAYQPDGRILLRVTPIPTDSSPSSGGLLGLLRLKSDGGVDETLSPVIPEVAGGVASVMARSGDKLVIGGAFSSINGHRTHNVARLNADGTVDTNFQGDATTPEIWWSDISGKGGSAEGNIAVQDDGKVLAVVFRGKLIRLNSDGGKDSTFRSPSSEYFWRVAVRFDGKLLVGWSGGDSIGRLKSDGSVDGSYTSLPLDSWVLQSSGKVVGIKDTGSFGRCRGELRRLNMDGTMDTAFAPDLATSNCLPALAIDGSDQIYVGGDFNSWDGHPAPLGLVRLNSDGTLDRSFGTPSDVVNAFNWSDRIWARKDGTVVLEFVTCLMVLKPDGSIAYNIELGNEPGAPSCFREQVLASNLNADGKLLIGGQFGLARLRPVPHLSALAISPGRGFSMRLGVVPNQPCRIEVSPDLENWQTVTTVIPTSDTFQFADPESANRAGRFYRAVAP